MQNVIETEFDRESLVRLYSSRHFEIDAGIVEIHYLPKNAPAREIRFLEVNRLVPEINPPEPIDFGVAINGAYAHTLNVLDVSPAQWDSIQTGRLRLPEGWTLDESREISRL